MSCYCQKQTELIDVQDAPQGFEASLIKKDIGNWVYLMECPECGQLWRVDARDKYQTQFAIKLSSVEGWESIDSVPQQKELLLQARGGITDEICIWAGCNGKRVKGVVYCVDHLYETDARK